MYACACARVRRGKRTCATQREAGAEGGEGCSLPNRQGETARGAFTFAEQVELALSCGCASTEQQLFCFHAADFAVHPPAETSQREQLCVRPHQRGTSGARYARLQPLLRLPPSRPRPRHPDHPPVPHERLCRVRAERRVCGGLGAPEGCTAAQPSSIDTVGGGRGRQPNSASAARQTYSWGSICT